MTTQPFVPAIGSAPPSAVLDDPVELRRFTRFDTDAAGARVADSSLRITGMYCAACAGTIESAVARTPGVLSVTVNASGERARVRWDPAHTRIAHIIAAVQRAGYDALPDAALEAREARRAESRAAIWRLFVAAFCAMQVMMMATPSYVARGDELSPDMRQLLNWGSWVLTLPVLLFAAGPYVRGAWNSLRARRIGMDVPVTLGILVTFVASTGATFDPGGLFGHEVYFDSLTMFVSFLLGGRLLEVRARHRVAQVLEAALDGLPQTALRLDAQGQAETVSVQRLRPGDRVRVPVGQAFPADGVLIEGSTQADESLLSGESAAVDKPCGALLTGGSLNLCAPVVMRVQQVGADTRLEAIIALMRDAMTQRPALARSADRWASPFLWSVLALAAVAAAVWSVIDPARAVWVAVAVLIVTCPCALSLAAPSALLATTSALARRGLLVQRLEALEALAAMRRVYLDKTGTVTQDNLDLRGMQRLQGAGAAWTDAALQAQAASLAAWSSHPLARTLSQAHGASAGSAVWRGLQEWPGQGLQGIDEQQRCWRLGSAAFVAADVRQAAEPAGAAVWLACDGQALARFDFDEVLRADAADAVRQLQQQGVEVCLLSGDRPERAQAMAQRLGIASAIGGATPESKLVEISRAQAQGLTVGMVGDGINDAPVLAKADVSLAMGQGALVARAHADAIIVSNRLADLPLARALAQRCLGIVRQNLVWAALYNAVCIPLALVGWLPPWAAGLGMASSSLLVIGNSMRLAR